MKKTKEEQNKNKKMPKYLHLRVVQINQQQTKVKKYHHISYIVFSSNTKL